MKRILRSLLVIFTILPGISHAQMGEYTFHDLIYVNERHNLYEQSEVTKLAEYQFGSRKEQQSMLETHFYTKKRWEYNKIIGYQLGIPAALTTAVITSTLICCQCRKKPEGERSIMLPVAVGTALGTALMRLTSLFIEGGYKYITDGMTALNKIYFPWLASDALDQLEIEYVRNKPFIPIELHHAIETNFIEAHTLQPYVRRGGLEENVHYARWALGLPRKLKTVIYDAEIIDAKLEGYPEQTIQHIKRFCIRHMAASTATTVRKIPYYFYGPPGVGKTRAAHLIAEMLELPIAVISLADKTSTALQGTVQEPGLLIRALSNRKARNAKNMILLIDDADRALNSQLDPFILSLFDPATRAFYSPYLDAYVDISNLGFIVIGNSDIKDEGLRNRLHIVKFEAYNTEYKRKVVWESLFPEMLEPHKVSSLPLSESDFSDRDRDTINNLIDFDKDPGFRSLKLELTNFIEDKVIQKNILKKFEEKPDEKPYAETIVPDQDDDDEGEIIKLAVEIEEATPPETIAEITEKIDATEHVNETEVPVEIPIKFEKDNESEELDQQQLDQNDQEILEDNSIVLPDQPLSESEPDVEKVSSSEENNKGSTEDSAEAIIENQEEIIEPGDSQQESDLIIL